MSEQEEWFRRRVLSARAEAGFEDVAIGALAVELDSSAQRSCMDCGESHAGINSGFRVGGRFGVDEAAREIEESVLFATGAGKQGAHGNGENGGGGHGRTVLERELRSPNDSRAVPPLKIWGNGC
jgi:hypothetical protein